MLRVMYTPISPGPGTGQVTEGEPIILSIVHINQIERESIYSHDKTTYLYTRFTFDLICYYNRQATAYVQGVNAPDIGRFPTPNLPRTSGGLFPNRLVNPIAQAPLPINAGGTLPHIGAPGITDDALLHFLMQPRGRLRVDFGDLDNCIVSPQLGYTVDANNGPKPEFCNILAIHADKTLTIHYRITTWINECANRQRVGPLLAHRWTRYVDVDEDHYATIVTEGEAIFRIDELARNNFNPDSFRSSLFHPVPPYCQRYGIKVIANSDNTGVRYSCVDKELPYNLMNQDSPAEPAVRVGHGTTKLEVWQSSSFQMGNVQTEARRQLVGFFGDVIRGGTVRGGGIVGALAFFAEKGATLVSRIAEGIYNVMPQYGSHYFVRATGDRRANRTDMMRKAIGYVFSLAPRGLWDRSTNAVSTMTHHENVVELQSTFTYSLENLVLGEINDIINPLAWARVNAQGLGPAIEQAFRNAEAGLHPEIQLFEPFRNGVREPFSRKVNVANPTFPHGGGTRGTLLERVFAQALSGSCQVPPAPTLSGVTEIPGDVPVDDEGWNIHPIGVPAPIPPAVPEPRGGVPAQDAVLVRS